MARQLIDFMRWHAHRHCSRNQGLTLACLLLTLLAAMNLWSAHQEHDRVATGLAYQKSARSLLSSKPTAGHDISQQLQVFFKSTLATPEFLRHAALSAASHDVVILRVSATEKKKLAHQITSQRIVMAIEGPESSVRNYTYDLLMKHPNLALDKLITSYRTSGPVQAELTMSHLTQ